MVQLYSYSGCMDIVVMKIVKPLGGGWKTTGATRLLPALPVVLLLMTMDMLDRHIRYMMGESLTEQCLSSVAHRATGVSEI